MHGLSGLFTEIALFHDRWTAARLLLFTEQRIEKYNEPYISDMPIFENSFLIRCAMWSVTSPYFMVDFKRLNKKPHHQILLGKDLWLDGDY